MIIPSGVLGMVAGIIGLVFGIIVLIFPKVLNYLVGIWLIVMGSIILYHNLFVGGG